MHYRDVAAGSLAATICWCGVSHAQDAASYPSKPVLVVLGIAPGGGTDIQSRLVSQKLSELLRQQFIVENRPSAAGADALRMVARAAPDGYTLLAVSSTFTVPFSVSQTAPMNLPDPIKDFAPITLMTRAPYLLAINPSIPAKSVKELIAVAKAKSGGLNFGGSPIGTSNHLAALWFFMQAGINATYVPYQGVGPTMNALLGGHVDAVMGNILSVGPSVKSGKLRALGVTSAQRSSTMPDVPTIAEQGVSYDYSSFFGWVAPAGTSAAIVDKLSVALAKVVNSPEIADRIRSDGAEPVGSTPEQFRQIIASEVPRWRKVVQDAGIKLQ